MYKLDINLDAGESFGQALGISGYWNSGDDSGCMPLASSVNIACGYHGGDPTVMNRTVVEAKKIGLAVGAHTAQPDLEGFGLRQYRIPFEPQKNHILYQIGALYAMCRANGVELTHNKPHGDLYERPYHEKEIAQAVVEATLEFDSNMILVMMPGGVEEKIAQQKGARVAYEGFPDLGYSDDGILQYGGDIPFPDAAQVVKQAVDMVKYQKITTNSGKVIDTPKLHTLCIHSLLPGAAEKLRAVREAFEREEIQIVPLPEVVN